jgi:metal-sulfur cluster biosynthetic enzyme
MALDPEVLEVLRGIVGPEIGINIVDLGLVYRAERMAAAIDIAMTMTARSCPLGEMMLEEARVALSQHFPGSSIAASLVWDPPWTPDNGICQGNGAASRPRWRSPHLRLPSCGARWLVVDKPPANKHRSKNLRLEFGQVPAFAVLLCSHAIVTMTRKPMAVLLGFAATALSAPAAIYSGA